MQGCPRPARAGLWLVHRGLRHARSEGSEGAAGPAEVSLLTRPCPAPPNRNDRPPLPCAPGTGAVLEFENLGRGAQSAPQQSLRRQQRDVVAGGAIDLDQVAVPKILDPRRVKGEHILCLRVP